MAGWRMCWSRDGKAYVSSHKSYVALILKSNLPPPPPKIPTYLILTAATSYF